MQTNCDDQFNDREEFIQFLKDEKVEMEKYKWIESEKNGHDVGQQAILDWIKKYAASYRTWWVKTHKNKS